MKKSILKSILITLSIAVIVTYSAMAQRVIKGTVYRDGKPAAGVTVEAHKSTESVFTGFDGLYEISVSDKCKYLKFTYVDDSRKLDIENNTSNEINFSFDGEVPVNNVAEEKGVSLKNSTELAAAGDKDFMSAYTLEKQFYEQKDYKSSILPWRKLYKNYPKSTLNIYLHGINMYQTFVETAKDHKLKALYVDSLMMIYNKRIKYFDQRGFNLGRQGTDYLKYQLDNENLTDDQLKPIMKKGYNYLDESIKLQGMESEIPVLILLMQSTRRLYSLGELEKEKIIENYDALSKIIDNYLKKDPKSEQYISTRDLMDQLFQTSGAADCDALISIYTPKYDLISSNIEDLKKMIRMLDRQNCEESPLFAKASEKLYSMEPSAESAYNMARFFVKSNELAKAETYYNQAISLEKDPLNLSKYYVELAKLSISKPNDAKNYTKKAIENNPNSGAAYLLLGNIYAYNSKSYGENDFERTFVFMVAVDYYNKAKKLDSTLESEANEKIATYSQYFPSKEDIFFNGLTVGQSYKVGGWINETTTIREKR